jgi:flagellar assembly protein FliH
MTGLSLEEFGRTATAREPAPSSPTAPPVDYDAAYTAGWEDAMRQVDDEQGRIADRLAERLIGLELDRRAEVASTLSALEPFLHEVFDKVLPRAAGRGFLGVLLEEVGQSLDEAGGRISIEVAPEETTSLTRLLERASLGPDQVTVKAQPALALSQALLRWDAGERRVDLSAVLTALDEALADFLETFAQGDAA